MLQTQSSRSFRGLSGRSVHTRLGSREHYHGFASNVVLAPNSQPVLKAFDKAHATLIETIVIDDNQLGKLVDGVEFRLFDLKGRLFERIREYGSGILIHGVFAVEL